MSLHKITFLCVRNIKMMEKSKKLIYLFTLILHAMDLNAQLTVYDEPHHPTLLNNAYIRVLDLKLLPGDTTLEHTHTEASVVIFMTHSTFAIQDKGKPPAVTTVVPGQTVYRPYDEKPVLHTVWVEDGSPFHCLVVEIKKKSHPFNQGSDGVLPLARLAWQERTVEAYVLEAGREEPFRLSPDRTSYLLTLVTGNAALEVAGEKHDLHVGDFYFIPPHQAFSLSGTDKERSACILLRFK
jgi:mannose-6-phosphate isomerase-like protein (cupin superfamily)